MMNVLEKLEHIAELEREIESIIDCPEEDWDGDVSQSDAIKWYKQLIYDEEVASFDNDDDDDDDVDDDVDDDIIAERLYDHMTEFGPFEHGLDPNDTW